MFCKSLYERQLDSTLTRIEYIKKRTPEYLIPYSRELHRLYLKAEWQLKMLLRNVRK